MRFAHSLLSLVLLAAPVHAQQATVKTAPENPLTELLMDRLRHGDTLGVKAALKRGADPNHPDYRGERPLFEAAHRGLGMVKTLIAAGAKPRLPGFERATLLHEAAADPQIVAFLLQHGFNPNARSDDGNTPLILAAEAGSLESARFLLLAGANAKAVAADGNDALARATLTNNVPLVRLLELYGASFNGNEASAVNNAAFMSSTEMLRFLASRHFSFNEVDEDGRSPLITCIMSNDATEQGEDADEGVVPAIQALIDGGAKLNLADKDGMTPLHWAASGGQDAIVRTLLKAGADPNRLDSMGESPLETSLSSVSPEDATQNRIVQLLALGGTRANSVNPQDGRTLLMRLAEDNKARLLEDLEVTPETLNMRGKMGETALMLAVSAGAADAVRWLLNRGADPSLKDNKGRSARDYLVVRQVVVIDGRIGANDNAAQQKEIDAQLETVRKNRLAIKNMLDEAIAKPN